MGRQRMEQEPGAPLLKVGPGGFAFVAIFHPGYFNNERRHRIFGKTGRQDAIG